MDLKETSEFLELCFKEQKTNQIVQKKILCLLEKLAHHHKPTYDHSMRVGILSKSLGDMQNRDPKAGIYAVLHDIGKINTPVEILDKKEGFSDGDMRIMKEHVVDGYNILQNMDLNFSAWIALTHHRYQPNFYPAEEEMPKYPFLIKNANPSTKLLADTWGSLVGIVDAYDAARNRRNSRFGGISLSPSELKDWLIHQNPSSERIIESAYANGTFTLEKQL